jgi:ketosteroid isomerase-like protein
MMKILLLPLIGSLVLSGAAIADDTGDVEAVLEAYSAALAAEDVAAAETRVLSEGTEFTIFEGSGRNIGWADYRDHHLAPEFAADGFDIAVYDWRDYAIHVDGDTATATFTIRMEYSVHGEDRERDASGTAILTRTGDGWRIRHLHTS